MKKKYIWTCDYCGEEYDTKHDCDEHELSCKKNPKNNGTVVKVPTLVIVGIVLFLIFVLWSVISNENNTKVNNQVSTQDPLVDCGVNEKCGGGTKRLTQSECINSICCGIGQVWVVMDKDQCKIKQQEYTQSNKPAPVQRIPIQIPQIPVIPPIEAPLCCKQNCNSITGTCTTSCTHSYFCY